MQKLAFMAALGILLLTGIALAGAYASNGPAHGTTSFTSASPTNPGTFEISWGDPERDPTPLFADPMRFHDATGVVDLGGDPDSPTVGIPEPGGPMHRFHIEHWGLPGSNKVIITYSYDANGDGKFDLIQQKIL